MCKPPESTLNNNNDSDNRTGNKTSPVADVNNDRPVHVVVAGAGPSGLLTVINLLRRNKDKNNNSPLPKYKITIVDIGPDHGVFTKDDLKRHRSWMIGLSTHGLSALKRVPDLYQKYVSQVGVLNETIHIHIGSKELKASVKEANGDDNNSYVIDRNFICAALARYIHEQFIQKNKNEGNEQQLELMYDTKILYVDGDNQRLLTRTKKNGENNPTEAYVDYDVLIGCDGIRSSVRECMLKNHRDFECHVESIFQEFKAVHIDRPKSIASSSELHVMPNCFKNCNGIALPELNDKINFSMGHPSDGDIDKELHSNDIDVIKNYFQKNFVAFELDDYDDFAQQWIDQDWSQTGQVHCNFYHSTKLNCLIMGDAAHATSPSLGQGMNTALADSAALDELLDEHDDDWNYVFPEFSKLRVKEGNALSYLSYYAYSFSSVQALYMTITGIARSFLNKWIPFISPDPMTEIGKGGKLSVAYSKMVALGRLPAVRKVNDDVRLRYFERMTGMIENENNKSSIMSPLLPTLVAVAAVGFGIAYHYN